MRSILFKTAFMALIMVAVASVPARAITEIGIGLSGGMSYDPNNIEEEIASYNSAIEAYKSANSGTEVSPLNIPYVGILGINIRFKIEFFLLRIGFQYLEAFLYPTMGSIEPPAGDRNTIRFNTWQISLPVSFGFLLEATRRCIFYFGGGFNTFFVNLQITQSDPDTALGLPNDRKKEVFDTYLFGYHIFLGAEFPLIIKRLSVSAEWVFQQGISKPVRSSKSSQKRTIDVTGNQIIFGINYYFTIGK